MSKQCLHLKSNGYCCGSYAFNLDKDFIKQGNLCDVHYWQVKAQKLLILSNNLKAKNIVLNTKLLILKETIKVQMS